MKRTQQPRRGDVYLCEFDPARGAEQSGTRPALIVERSTFSALGSKRHVLVAPISSSPKCARLPFCVAVSANKQTGLKQNSFVNLSHVHAFTKDRLLKHLGSAPEATMHKVDDALRLIFDLDD